MRLTLLLLAVPLFGATVSVCPSGCTYPDLQTALNTIADGTIVELTAGATYSGPFRLTSRTTPPEHVGEALKNITIRTTDWRKLPGAGIGITETDSHVAIIEASNNSPALQIGADLQPIALNGVNIGANTITWEATSLDSASSNDQVVVCGVRSPGTMPAPLVAGQKYYGINFNSGTRVGQLALTPGGAAIDLTSVGSAGEASFYARPYCNRADEPTNIVIQGIKFTTATGVSTPTLVQIGGDAAYTPKLNGPFSVQFRHSIFTGLIDETSPQVALGIYDGAHHLVSDCWIGNTKVIGGGESKGIGFLNTFGATVRNTYIAAASINVLVGGAVSNSQETQSDIHLINNYFEKPGDMFYIEGAGAPSGNCYFNRTGAFYRNTTPSPNTCANGACYKCQANGTWLQDLAATYKSATYNTKNLGELKDCENCRIEGNYLYGNFAGPDGGQGWCFGVSTTGVGGGGAEYQRGYHIALRNNHCNKSWAGILVGNSITDATQLPQKDNVAQNNLGTNMGLFPELSMFPSPTDAAQRTGLKFSLATQGLDLKNNTFRGPAGYIGMNLTPTNYATKTLIDAQIDSNITYGDSTTYFPPNIPAVAQLCNGTTGLFLVQPNDAKRYRSNIFWGVAGPFAWLATGACPSTIAQDTAALTLESSVGYVSASDARLDPTSNYSADNASPAFLSPQGADVGADVDAVEQYTIPAAARLPSMAQQLNLAFEPAQTTIVITYVRPRSAPATPCTVTLYDGYARSALHMNADTNSAPNRADNRASSTVNTQTGQVRFVAGAVAPLTAGTPYAYMIDCGPGYRPPGHVTTMR